MRKKEGEGASPEKKAINHPLSWPRQLTAGDEDIPKEEIPLS